MLERLGVALEVDGNIERVEEIVDVEVEMARHAAEVKANEDEEEAEGESDRMLMTRLRRG